MNEPLKSSTSTMYLDSTHGVTMGHHIGRASVERIKRTDILVGDLESLRPCAPEPQGSGKQHNQTATFGDGLQLLGKHICRNYLGYLAGKFGKSLGASSSCARLCSDFWGVRASSCATRDHIKAHRVGLLRFLGG